MANPRSKTEARFASIAEALANTPGVTHVKSASQLFGSSHLKFQDKIFAKLSWYGAFIVKLPKVRVDALVESGAGERFDANRGRPMNEWLEVRSESADEWLQLAREALAFVRT